MPYIPHLSLTNLVCYEVLCIDIVCTNAVCNEAQKSVSQVVPVTHATDLPQLKWRPPLPQSGSQSVRPVEEEKQNK